MQESTLSAAAAVATAAAATGGVAAITIGTANGIDQAQFEADKRAVYK